MRTSSLQDLYLQRPTTMLVLICMISVLPWIVLGDFSTKGEPREAAVAVSMLTTNNWVLPEVYADEFAYKPPMAHWLMAIFSLPQGHVSEFTARLPSSIAFIVLIGLTVFFFGKRLMKFHVVAILALIMMTCIELHRAAMAARVDMVLTVFMVAGLYQLYRWEDKLELKGLPVIIPLLFGFAILTKGLVGVVLPLFIFLIYLLMLRKYRSLIIFKSLLYIGVSSLFLPLLWYIAAWEQGGMGFLSVVIAENFGRFFHFSVSTINYDLGHENGAWYNFMTLIAGFVPWTALLFFSLFGIKIQKPERSVKDILKGWWNKILAMDKIHLFSLVAIVCIVFFYSIPSSKRSVYLMPAYPFIALFCAEYLLYLTEYRTKVTRVFAAFFSTLVTVGFIALTLTLFGVIDLATIVSQYTNSEQLIRTADMAAYYFSNPSMLSVGLLVILLGTMLALWYQMFRKINIKILYATFALMFAVNMMIDGGIMRGIRKQSSSRPFAEQINKDYPLHNDNLYVTNNLKQYRNLYGLNFYMGNRYRNFENELPAEGYFLAGEKELEKVKANYGNSYLFRVLETSDNVIDEVRQRIVLCSFTRQ